MLLLLFKVLVAVLVPYSGRVMARIRTQNAEAGTSTLHHPNRHLPRPTQTMVGLAAQNSTEGQMARWEPLLTQFPSSPTGPQSDTLPVVTPPPHHLGHRKYLPGGPLPESSKPLMPP